VAEAAVADRAAAVAEEEAVAVVAEGAVEEEAAAAAEIELRTKGRLQWRKSHGKRKK
jgi:hypothetical protein